MNTNTQFESLNFVAGSQKAQRTPRLHKVVLVASVVLLVAGAYYYGANSAHAAAHKSTYFPVSDYQRFSRTPTQTPHFQRTTNLATTFTPTEEMIGAALETALNHAKKKKKGGKGIGKKIGKGVGKAAGKAKGKGKDIGNAIGNGAGNAAGKGKDIGNAIGDGVGNAAGKVKGAGQGIGKAVHNGCEAVEPLRFVGVPIEFDLKDGKWLNPHAVDVTENADLWGLAFWENEQAKAEEDLIGTGSLLFHKVQTKDGDKLFYNGEDVDDKRFIDSLANQKIGLVACIAGDQFKYCGNENYACGAILPGEGIKAELIKPGNVAVISYFLDLGCNLHAYLTAHAPQ